jgi:hypothetical protein
MASQPRLHYANFRREALEIASTLFTVGGGLHRTSILYTDDEWAILHNPLIARPTPEPPADFAHNAGAAAIAHHKIQLDAYSSFVKDSALLKRMLLTAIGPTISQALRHPITDHLEVTVLDIMTYLKLHYGTFNEEDFQQLSQSFNVPFSTEDNFDADATRLNEIFVRLDSLGHPKSIADQMDILSIVTNHMPSIQNVIQLYKNQVPVFANRTFVDLRAYISLHLPNHRTPMVATQYQSGFVGAMVRTASAGGTVTANLNDTTNVNANGSSASTTRNAIIEIPGYGRVFKYCYKHGYGNHSGMECSVMRRDNKTYLDIHRNAVTHKSVEGGHH